MQNFQLHGYLNISSDSQGSIENLDSTESNDDEIKLIIDADEPPTKRGKNNFKVILVQIKKLSYVEYCIYLFVAIDKF